MKMMHKELVIQDITFQDYNVVIDGKNFFDQPIKNNKVTSENIRKISIGHDDDYTTGYFLDYTYFKKYYKMMPIDLSKQQVLDADPREIFSFLKK